MDSGLVLLFAGTGEEGIRDILYSVLWVQRREGTGLKIINPKLSKMYRYSQEGCIL